MRAQPRWRETAPARRADPMDAHVGARLRQRRTTLGMSQATLAAMLGVTFQQLQKYERGVNRIAASRLWDLSVILGVPADFFFEDAPAAGRTGSITVADPMRHPETLALVRAFHRIADPTVRDALLRLVCAAGGMKGIPILAFHGSAPSPGEHLACRGIH